MTPRELLAAADALLAGRSPGLARCWQRACAAFLRIALERALADFWQRRAPGVAGANTRTQLLILPLLAGEPAAETARRSWGGLCRAVHHHSYELAPTAAELRGWHTDVTALVTRLGQSDRSIDG